MVINLHECLFSLVDPRRDCVAGEPFYQEKFNSWLDYYKERTGYVSKNWRIIEHSGFQKQTDYINCGVYCCYFIERILKSGEIGGEEWDCGEYCLKIRDVLDKSLKKH